MWGGTDEAAVDRRDPGLARCRRHADRHRAGLRHGPLRGDRRQGDRRPARRGRARHQVRARLAHRQGQPLLRPGRQAGPPLSRARRRSSTRSSRACGGSGPTISISTSPTGRTRRRPIAETMGALEDLKRAGKIRAIGASNVSPADLEAYVAAGGLDAIQEQFSMVHRDIEADAAAALRPARRLDPQLLVAGARPAHRQDRPGAGLRGRRPAHRRSALQPGEPPEGRRLRRRRSARSPRRTAPRSPSW